MYGRYEHKKPRAAHAPDARLAPRKTPPGAPQMTRFLHQPSDTVGLVWALQACPPDLLRRRAIHATVSLAKSIEHAWAMRDDRVEVADHGPVAEVHDEVGHRTFVGAHLLGSVDRGNVVDSVSRRQPGASFTGGM